MIWPVMTLFANDPGRAVVDIARVDQRARVMARAFRIPSEGSRTWIASAGGISGGWAKSNFMFVRKDDRLTLFSVTLDQPYRRGNLPVETLAERIRFVLKTLFPSETKWTLLAERVADPEKFEPPLFLQVFSASNTKSDGIRKVSVRVERATGMPYLIIAQYADADAVAEAVLDPSRKLEITLGAFGKSAVPPL